VAALVQIDLLTPSGRDAIQRSRPDGRHRAANALQIGRCEIDQDVDVRELRELFEHGEGQRIELERIEERKMQRLLIEAAHDCPRGVFGLAGKRCCGDAARREPLLRGVSIARCRIGHIDRGERRAAFRRHRCRRDGAAIDQRAPVSRMRARLGPQKRSMKVAPCGRMPGGGATAGAVGDARRRAWEAILMG